MTPTDALAQALREVFDLDRDSNDHRIYKQADLVLAALPSDPWADAERLAEALRNTRHNPVMDNHRVARCEQCEALRQHDEATR